MIKRATRHNRNRTALAFPNQPPGAAATEVFSISGSAARIVFSAPVVVRSLPVDITRQAAGAGPQLPPTGYTVVNATTIDLAYAAPVVATDVLTIPGNIPEIRTTSGGPIAAAVWTF